MEVIGEWKGFMLGNSLRKAPFFILAKKRMRKSRPGRGAKLARTYKIQIPETQAKLSQAKNETHQ